jgi:CO dehydrogenase/acetyl-CoA synthase alpha subunit
MRKEIQEAILNDEGYITVDGEVLSSKEDILTHKESNLNTHSLLEEYSFKYKLTDYMNTVRDENKKPFNLKEKLLVTYSRERAEKDREDRLRLIDKGLKLLSNPSTINGSLKRGEGNTSKRQTN